MRRPRLGYRPLATTRIDARASRRCFREIRQILSWESSALKPRPERGVGQGTFSHASWRRLPEASLVRRPVRFGGPVNGSTHRQVHRLCGYRTSRPATCLRPLAGNRRGNGSFAQARRDCRVDGKGSAAQGNRVDSGHRGFNDPNPAGSYLREDWLPRARRSSYGDPPRFA